MQVSASIRSTSPRRPIDLELLDHWLTEWAHSMRSYRPDMMTVGNDAPWRNAVHAVNEDYTDIVEERRMSGIVEAVDSCIDSLQSHARWAIWRKYDQVTFWPWARLDYEMVLMAAKMEVGQMMRDRGYTC